VLTPVLSFLSSDPLCVMMYNEQVITNERDSDSDEDVADELRADYVDERTGDVPPPQKK